VALLVMVTIGAAVAQECAPIQGWQRIRPSQAGFQCVARLQSRLAPATLNDKQKMALSSFVADVGCRVFESTIKQAGYDIKNLPHQMLQYTKGHRSQLRRNAEVSLFFQPTSCVTPGSFRAQKFDIRTLPPHTNARIVSEATDTGRVSWHGPKHRPHKKGLKKALKNKKKRAARRAASTDSTVNGSGDDDSTIDDAGQPCTPIEGFVYTHSKRYCCPADHPNLIGLLCYENCPAGFDERGFGCHPLKDNADGHAFERAPRLSKHRPSN